MQILILINLTSNYNSGCLDSSNNKHAIGETWEEDCIEFTCGDNSFLDINHKKCDLDASDLPPLCEAVYGEGDKCCPDRLVCYEGKITCEGMSEGGFTLRTKLW